MNQQVIGEQRAAGFYWVRPSQFDPDWTVGEWVNSEHRRGHWRIFTWTDDVDWEDDSLFAIDETRIVRSGGEVYTGNPKAHQVRFIDLEKYEQAQRISVFNGFKSENQVRSEEIFERDQATCQMPSGSLSPESR